MPPTATPPGRLLEKLPTRHVVIRHARMTAGVQRAWIVLILLWHGSHGSSGREKGFRTEAGKDGVPGWCGRQIVIPKGLAKRMPDQRACGISVAEFTSLTYPERSPVWPALRPADGIEIAGFLGRPPKTTGEWLKISCPATATRKRDLHPRVEMRDRLSRRNECTASIGRRCWRQSS